MVKYRDYSLTGSARQAAIESGLAGAQWYATPIPRKEMKALIQRRDGPALRDTAIWFAILATFGVMMVQTWGSWWFLPFFLVYSVFYGSCGDSRWHECGHGTAFKTQWMNQAIYHLASFMILRNGSLWRWSHTRHHTDTLIVGRDPEIAVMRPPSFAGIFLDLLYLRTGWMQIGKLANHVRGKLSEEEADFLPEGERWKVFLEARIQLAIYLAVAVWCVAIGSLLPAMFIGIPTFTVAWLEIVFFGYTQHAGMREDV
ncbi:MAG: fatty acid desaturase, partial [Pseudomonadota bacterium]